MTARQHCKHRPNPPSPQVVAVGVPGGDVHLPALPALLPAAAGGDARRRVLLPGRHHPGLHLPRPRAPALPSPRQPYRQPEAPAGLRRPGGGQEVGGGGQGRPGSCSGMPRRNNTGGWRPGCWLGGPFIPRAGSLHSKPPFMARGHAARRPPHPHTATVQCRAPVHSALQCGGGEKEGRGGDKEGGEERKM